ncbi:hypothetical protein [Edaphobacter flagellatus]|uniref:hypothetical protein n=1 Tax=Edaphobacter flagellatus TaxID=1933044 RepID=UPI0021B26D31|nr:hypothetical protein [Edaphobacter flagellatus]
MKKPLFTAVLGFVLSWAPSISAQMHKVTKPENVVRAVGVYEWTGDLAKPTAIRFVPVTVFIDGEIQDAGIYMPRPIPFALVNGNIYELEDAGLPKGTLELESALNTTQIDGAPAAPFIQGWTAYGSYKPPAPEKKAAALKPSKTLSTITSSGGSAKTDNKTDSKPADTTADQKNTDQKTADTDRPTMRRRTSSDDTSAPSPSTTTTSTTTTTSDDDDKAERPTLRRRSPEDAKNDKQKKKNETASVISTGSLNDDPDRPRLSRNNAAHDTDDLPKLLGVPPGMKQMVAVSDAKNRDPHPFARPWEDDAERAAILTKMQSFARAKLAAYGIVPGTTPPTAIAGNTTVGGTTTLPTTAKTGTSIEGSGPPKLKRGIPTDDTLGNIAPPPATSPAATTAPAKSAGTKTSTTAAKHRAAAATKAAPPVTLADEQLKGYLLSYGGAPTYVYSAHTVETGSVMRYVTIVAQADALGQLQVALASVTDAAHLDRTPWMRLVDAVDVEASNRASLLFELRGQSGRQFALYRVIAAKPEQIFVTSSGS